MDQWGTLAETFFNWESMRAAIPDLLTTGVPNTLILAVTSAIIGTVVGLLLAVAGISGTRWLRWPARLYTDVFRGLPAAVTILLIGVGLAPQGLLIWGPDPYPLGILALSLIAAAYFGEIFRSGIQSVEAGQLEAARALGFSYASAMRLIIVPLGVRRVLPAWVNQLIALIKDSSLIYFLGLMADQRDLFRIGQDSAANTGNESALVLAGLFYLLLTVPLTHLVNVIDRRLRLGRRVVEPTTEPPAAEPVPVPEGAARA
ncbi:polar amino acid transport system permease protein/polar amino acid transport system substrate-binding protein [Kitasatospora gansuensis]|uniref:Polar amino acid transport system permease protein/polar amino acid transport system substrate-binding protein n=1 Tax=Kitasatospora gansuensis TaxID=258050 RepID=A0A7W7WFU4_9ACTN|nr:amino acid ABC transporter permease [Kitasatospora gansuensis]MBB4946137.1 polar amino acid transport system permease protein/polar amino acid transport system substrate-binding protein [Kitasatospora gansuensis]